MKSILIIIFVITTSLLAAEYVRFSSEDYALNVLTSTDSETILELNFGEFQKIAVEINGDTFYRIGLKKESRLYDAGYPELPKVTRSLIVPDNARMSVEIISSQYTDFDLAVAPSKGMILRNIDPNTVPYEFAAQYAVDEFYPADQASLSTPFILRDFRGITLNAKPFAYNPVTEILRVYHNLTVRVYADGIDDVNVKNRIKETYSGYFKDVYANRFLNFITNSRYDLVDEEGRIMVICHADFMEAAQPYINWKRQKGFLVNVFDVNDIGNAFAIETFIQEQYDLNDDLTFVQLFGDALQVPTLSSGGGGADPKYALVEGTDDYLDIFIGRFSAETVEHVESQVAKTIWYERDLGAEDWLAKGIGIASTQGAGQGDDNEADNVHMDIIRTNLLGYGYTEVDQIYDPSANASAVAASVNEGRGIINYVGHGSTTSWATSGFNNNHVNQLTNDYKYPFINSVACVNGNFTNATCFAEEWLRATNNNTGAPTGAIVMFASTINQSWAPPMAAEDEAIDLFTGNTNYEGTPDMVTTIGSLWYNSESEMLEIYGANDISETWHIFGDASLFFRTKVSETMVISHLSTILMGQSSFDVNTDMENAQVALYEPTFGLIASGYTDASGNISLDLTAAPTVPADLTLTISAKNRITSIETVSLIPADGPYVIFSEYTIADADGNDNGLADYNESFALNFTILNVGVEEAIAVECTISTESEYVTITDPTATFGNIAPDESTTVENAFGITVDANIPDGEVVQFQLSAEGQETWLSGFNMTLYAPILEFGGFVIDDTAGNGNARLDPGETANFIISVENTGSSVAMEVVGNLISSDPLITISNSSAYYAGIDAGSSNEQIYVVSASANTPGGHMAFFDFTAIAQFGYTVTANFETQVGGYHINEEFETFPPDGWSIEGGENWIPGSSNQAGGIPPEAAFHWSPSTVGVQRLISDVINTSGASTLDLEFKHSIDSYIDSEYEIRIETTSDGTNWNTIQTYPPANLAAYTEIITIENDDVGSATFQLAFTFDGNSYNVNNWCVDDVILGGGNAAALGEISGNIVSEDAEIDITDVTVTAGNQFTHPDASGDYTITLFPGTYEVQASINGYFTETESNVEVEADGNTNVDFTIIRIESPTTLEGTISGLDISLTWVCNIAGNGSWVCNITRNENEFRDSYKKTLSEKTSRNMRPFSYYNVYCSIDESDFEVVATPSDPNYTHTVDASVNQCVFYITVVYDDGLSESFASEELAIDMVDSPGADIPAVTKLNGNYPNPFNPTTKINYSLAQGSNVAIDVFNARGQKIKTLVNQYEEAGNYTAIWDGVDSNNRPVASGLYFYKMKTTRYTSTKKMILLK